jgi:hypothetical protein
MAKFLSPDRARQIMRNILSHRPGRSYDCTRHEELGIVVVKQGEQASIGEECRWKEISEEFFNQEYVQGKYENTFHELCMALKEGVAIALGLDIKKFCDEVTIGKSGLVYFLLEYEHIACKQTSWRSKVNHNQVSKSESYGQSPGTPEQVSVNDSMTQQMKELEDILDDYYRNSLDNKSCQCFESCENVLKTLKNRITEFREFSRQQNSDLGHLP